MILEKVNDTINLEEGKKYKLTGMVAVNGAKIEIHNSGELLYSHTASGQLHLDKTYTAQSGP